MQADSLLRIHLYTHNIHNKTNTTDFFGVNTINFCNNDKTEMTGVLIDDQTPIHILITHHKKTKKYSFAISSYKNNPPTKQQSLIADYFTPDTEEKALFDAFFTSTPLHILQQHLTKIFAQRINIDFVEHTDILTRLIQRIPRRVLGYSNKDYRLYYQNTQHKDYTTHTYWDSLDKIHAWCHRPRFYYLPENNTWEQNQCIDIISHIMSQYPWDEHHPLSMHETIQLIRQAQALNIPSLPKDLSEIHQ